MRRGDIIINPWVSQAHNGDLNPNYASIYLDKRHSLDYSPRRITWATDVAKDEREWKVVGHIDLEKLLKMPILQALDWSDNDD